MERIINKEISFIQASLLNFNTLTEQNIFNLTLFLTQKALNLSYKKEINLKISHIRQLLESKVSKYNNKDIIDKLEELIGKKIKLNVLHSKNNSTKTILLTIYTKIIFDHKKNIISFTLNEEFIKYLKEREIGSKNGVQYSKVLMSITQKSKNKYTPKILEFLSLKTKFSTNRTNNNVLVSLTTLREVFNLADDIYREFKDFNYYILKKVQKECQKFDLDFTYHLHKDRRTVVSIEFEMTNAAKKKFYNKIKYTKTNDEKDEILQYVRKDIQIRNIDYLNEKLNSCELFHQKIASITAGNKFSMYKFEYKNAKTNDGKPLYRLVNFNDLDIIIDYFTLKDGDKFLEYKLIQDILNEKRA